MAADALDKSGRQLTTREIVESGLVGMLEGVGNVSNIRPHSSYISYGVRFNLAKYPNTFDLEYHLELLSSVSDLDSRINRLSLWDYDSKIAEQDLWPLKKRIETLFPEAEFLGFTSGYFNWFLPLGRFAADSVNRFGYKRETQ